VTTLAVIVVIAVGSVTFPSATGAVSASIQRAGRPDDSTIGSSTAAATRSGRLVALPATIAFVGADAQIRVIPAPSSDEMPRRPIDPSVVSWWMTGRHPGATGGTVVSGHVTTPAGGGGLTAFGGLELGDLILLTGADGTIHHYRVTERRQFSQARLAASLVADPGSSVLLISCAGRSVGTGPDDAQLLITAGEAQG